MTINEWCAAVHALAVDKGWWECETCDGGQWMRADALMSVPCPTCNGTGQHRNKAELIALVHSELSEALEALRRPELDDVCDKCGSGGEPWNDDGTQVVCRKCEGSGRAIAGGRFAEELADAVIRIMDICDAYGIDLERAIAEKHAYNQTRSNRHGGKAF